MSGNTGFTKTVAPVPDPTVLTTQQSKDLRDQMLREIEHSSVLMRTRLDAVDKATALLSENFNHMPTLLDRETAHIREFFNEKFESIRLQFSMVDVRILENQKVGEISVNAALQAQKESSSKSELNFTKQIDGIKEQLGLLGKSLDDKIDSLRQRVTAMESAISSVRNYSQTYSQDQQSHSLMSANTIAIVAIVAAVGVALFVSLGGGHGGGIILQPPASFHTP